MFELRTALLSMLVLLSGVATAAPNVYEVSASIRHGGQTIAAPTLLVKPGASAEMSASGENGFRLAVVVTPTETDAVDVSIDLGTSHASLKTTITTLTNKPIAVSSGELEVNVTIGDGDS